MYNRYVSNVDLPTVKIQVDNDSYSTEAVMLFDTGAQVSLVYQSTINQLQLNPIGKRNMKLAGHDGEGLNKNYLTYELRIGDEIITAAGVNDLPRLPNKEYINLLIGSDQFGKFMKLDRDKAGLNTIFGLIPYGKRV